VAVAVVVVVVEVAFTFTFNGVAVMRLIKAMSDSPGSCIKAGDAYNADVDVDVIVLADENTAVGTGEKAWLVIVQDNKTTQNATKLAIIVILF
jgi:hypothetical protein